MSDGTERRFDFLSSFLESLLFKESFLTLASNFVYFLSLSLALSTIDEIFSLPFREIIYSPTIDSIFALFFKS